MPVITVDGFLDATPVSITTSNITTPIPGTPYLAAGSTSTQVSTFSVARNGDWLECDGMANASGSTAVKSGGVYRSLADVYTFSATTYAYGAVRFKKRTAYEAQPYQLVSFCNTSSPATTVAVLSSNDIPGGGVVGKEYFLEWAIDCTNWVIKRRLDGVVLSDVAIAAAHQTAFLAQNKSILFGLVALSVFQRYGTGIDVRDIYFAEKVSGETTDWLGEVSLVAMPVTALPAPWTGSDGAGGTMTALAAINTPVTTLASLSAPYAVSDIDLTEVDVKVDTSNVIGTVHGVFATTVAKRLASGTGKLSETIVADGASTTIVSPALPTSMVYCPIRFLPKSPSGQPWTKQKLADMTVKLSVQ